MSNCAAGAAPKFPASLMSRPFSWGILGTGAIAHTFARGLAHARLSRLAAVASRTSDKARAFAAEFAGSRPHDSYEALLADPEINAVYISTPHPAHATWAIRAAEAGKHILCEKPLGMNHAEGMVIAEAARAGGVLLAEAFMYRHAPQTDRIVEIVRQGILGEVKFVQATFGFRIAYDPAKRHFSNALGGGGILDVGCYPVSFARLIAGAVVNQRFVNPTEVKGCAALNPVTGTDDWAAATLIFPGGLVAQAATGVALAQDNSVRIYGTGGWLHVPTPWIPAREGGVTRFYLHRPGGAHEEIVVETSDWLYAIEADALATAALAGAREVAAMSVADTLGNLTALDAWRQSAGLTYHAELPENFSQTISGRPLRFRGKKSIPTASLAGLDKPVARLVMGCDNQRAMPHAAAMWDDWFERGGNCFDTSFHYGGGVPEKLLGHWLRHRGVRSECVLIVKGAHTPLCTPEWVSRQLQQSLERLQTDEADIYIMHRDNPDVPVGEFVDVLDEHARAGRIKIFGGSNWSIERFQKANAYARRKGRREFTVLNNNFSLARMVQPVWAGCVTASDPASRRWLKRTQTPLFAWSSQARGFFTERAGPDRRDDPELVNSWYSEDNFLRRSRAHVLARERGVQPINIALAYVLAQPFPIWPLVGPREIAETVSTLGVLDVTLTPNELAWLNLGRTQP